MNVPTRLAIHAAWLLTALAGGGCLARGPATSLPASVFPSTSVGSAHSPAGPGENAVRLVSAQGPAPPPAGVNRHEVAGSPFSEGSELSVDALVEQVLARNPSAAQMVAAWQAASARYPQVTSLDDPMVGATVGPASIGSNDVDFAYRLEASQKFPFPGKLRLRGQMALAEAAAAGSEVGDTRLQLVEAAKTAFYDYYLVHRALAVNEEGLQLLRDLRGTAEARFTANQATIQDVLQTDVEIGRQRGRRLTLERTRKVAQARLNTLLHLPPDSPLPRPPQTLDLAEALPVVGALRLQAAARRPDLQALASRVEAEQAAVALAQREYCPDVEVMAAYDAFWQPEEKDLRPMLGVRLNVPLRLDRRRAAVAEAQARLAQRLAELEARTDQVHLQVQEAYEQVLESEQVLRLYRETILPAADENVKAARSAYVAGRIPLLSYIEAQRGLVELRDRHYEALAEYHRRRATLERVTGGPPGPGLPAAGSTATP